METEYIFDSLDGTSFVVYTDFKNVPELARAYLKYGVAFPRAKYIITCYASKNQNTQEDEKTSVQFMHKLEGYGIVEDEFTVFCEYSIDDRESLKQFVLPMLYNNLDNMYWGDIIAAYLGERGIVYEEAFECDCDSCDKEDCDHRHDHNGHEDISGMGDIFK